MVLALALFGASEPLPSNAPSVVVFTLVPSGTVTIESAARIAAALSVRLSSEGGVAVKSAPPDVKQADFLNTARRLGVDYYVTGFAAPLGGGYSAAVQLVATRSGVSVWSGSATLSGTDDVTDLADIVHRVVASRSQAFAGVVARTPSPASPAPAAAGAKPLAAPPAPQAAAVGGAAPGAALPPGAPATEPPAPVPSLDPRNPTVAVLETTGTDDEPYRAYVADALAVDLAKHGLVVTRWHRQVPALGVEGALLCVDTKTSLLLAPALETTSTDPQNYAFQTVRTELATFDCRSKTLGRPVSGEASNFLWETAAQKAVSGAVDAYMKTVVRTR